MGKECVTHRRKLKIAQKLSTPNLKTDDYLHENSSENDLLMESEDAHETQFNFKEIP